MKKFKSLAFLAVLFIFAACGNTNEEPDENVQPVVQSNIAAELKTEEAKDSTPTKANTEWQNGDVVFQITSGPLMVPLQTATKSKWTHCGIVWKNKKGETFVIEANQGVERTPVNEWIASGENGQYLQMRLKERAKFITPATEDEMFKKLKSLQGKPYDTKYMWSDEKYYCSELVWKAYQSGGIELCAPKKIKEYNLGSPEVVKAMEKKWGGKIPMEEPAVAPVDISNSALLEKIYEN